MPRKQHFTVIMDGKYAFDPFQFPLPNAATRVAGPDRSPLRPPSDLPFDPSEHPRAWPGQLSIYQLSNRRLFDLFNPTNAATPMAPASLECPRSGCTTDLSQTTRHVRF